MELIILGGIIGAISISVIKFAIKGKPSDSKRREYTPTSDVYSGKNRDYSSHAPVETHRKAPYEEVDKTE
ncbi:hypothetical protein MUO14_17190 [Halobacillus shinanisalinarum]|uniref:YtzI protein n=2 Tax=Halobacillus TaxID=45667 RepID=A0ABY4H802_9BACI|nr:MULTISPECIES: hypothetical protein [Halobacillus]UOQ92207.1 hypothetical protein MUO14_17190 [Halobacillus shinanisalinarum]UOR10990.1 hypothetical protein MUO15_15470 [Halobacillus amylolyticus]